MSNNEQEKHEKELIDILSRYLFKRDFAKITCIVENEDDGFYNEYTILAGDILGNFYRNRDKNLSPFKLFKSSFDMSFYEGATRDLIISSPYLNELKNLLHSLNQEIRKWD